MPCPSLRRALKAVLRRKPETKRPEESEPIIFRSPMELLLEIYSHLPLPSKVCLALSCRDLNQLFKAAFDDDRLVFPRMPVDERNVSYVQNEEYQLRMGLLKQLEDSRRACCGRGGASEIASARGVGEQDEISARDKDVEGGSLDI